MSRGGSRWDGPAVTRRFAVLEKPHVRPGRAVFHNSKRNRLIPTSLTFPDQIGRLIQRHFTRLDSTGCLTRYVSFIASRMVWNNCIGRLQNRTAIVSPGTRGSRPKSHRNVPRPDPAIPGDGQVMGGSRFDLPETLNKTSEKDPWSAKHDCVRFMLHLVKRTQFTLRDTPSRMDTSVSYASTSRCRPRGLPTVQPRILKATFAIRHREELSTVARQKSTVLNRLTRNTRRRLWSLDFLEVENNTQSYPSREPTTNVARTMTVIPLNSHFDSTRK